MIADDDKRAAWAARKQRARKMAAAGLVGVPDGFITPEQAELVRGWIAAAAALVDGDT